jgi:hypothetical protein
VVWSSSAGENEREQDETEDDNDLDGTRIEVLEPTVLLGRAMGPRL